MSRHPGSDRPRAVFVVPLLLVTAFAVYGQYGYGFDHYTKPDDPWTYKFVIAIGAAIALESIANYVQWHAHQARVAGATPLAVKYARYSYLIALGVGALNYAHFCEPNGSPTPAAVMFAVFSAVSPWLWSLHTRQAEYRKLQADGLLDTAAARFGAERWRSYPVQTWRARRYSILYNIQDPRDAWAAYQADRDAAEARREAVRSHRQAAAHEAAKGSPLRALWVRTAGVIAPAPAGATGGVTAGAKRGATGGVVGGATGGVTPVRPASATSPAVTPPPGATDQRAPLHAVPSRRTPPASDGPALQEAATRWALAHDARREPIPGWRPIHDQFGPRGLSEYRAKAAAKAARSQAASGTAVTDEPASVVITNGASS